VWKLALALFVSDLFILVSGVIWLGILFRTSASLAMQWGFYPFIVSNAIKIAAVGLTLPRLLKYRASAQPW
jgi:biotin transporter BioY